MTIRQATRQSQGRSLTAFRRRFTAATVRGSSLQWVVACVVGLVLGICVVGFALLPQQWTFLFIVAALCPFIVMIAGNVQKFLLAIIIIEIPYGLQTHLYYREGAAVLGAIGGLNISVMTICLAGLYALWFAQLLAKKAVPPPYLICQSLPLVVFILTVALSAVVARDAALASFEIFMLIQVFLFYIYIINAVQNQKDVLFVVSVLLFGLVLQSSIMIWVWLTGIHLNFGSITTDNDLGSRLAGTAGSPNGSAAYLTFMLVPALSVLTTQVERWHKWLAALAFGLGGVALFLTQSRGGWLAFVVAVTLFYLLAWRRGLLSPIIHVAAVISVLALSIIFQDDIATRLFGYDGGAAYSRIPLARLALHMIRDHPLLGVGANNFLVALPQYVTPEFSREWLFTVHNKYLLVWAETGIFALAAFLWFLLTTLQRGWQVWKLNDHFLSPLALGFTLVIVGHMLHMTVDIFNARLFVQMLWLIAGLITAMNNIGGARAENITTLVGPQR